MTLNEANFQLPPDLRKQENHRRLDGKGLKCLRAINGSLQWLVTNSRPDLAARVSLSASATSNPTYGDLQSANKLIRQAQRYKEIPINIPSIPLKRLTLGTFTDAAWAVRPDGSSQGGYLLFFADKDLLDGKESSVSIMDWKSWKLKRKVRSSLAAESQALADAVDNLNYLRLFFAECLISDSIDLRQSDRVLSMMPKAHVITDCKSLYDALERSESAGLGLSEKRTAIEVTATREVMRETGISTRWVNSDRQIADVLTKPQVPAHNLQALQSTGRWKIVFDDQFTSAKKLRKAARDANLKKNTQTSQQRALQRSIGQPQWKNGQHSTTTRTNGSLGTTTKTTASTTKTSSSSTSSLRRTTFHPTPQIHTYTTPNRP